MSPKPLPDALLFIASGCPHCPAVLDALARALKEGKLGRLQAINLQSQPREAEALGVRSAPWTRIGPFELTGALSPGEIRQWIGFAAEECGWAEYYSYLLQNRQLDRVLHLIRERPGTLGELLGLFADEATPIDLRIGISAVFEELQGSEMLGSLAPKVEPLTLAESAQTRADVCHFLGLAGNPEAIPAVERLLDDEDEAVREIAGETLALLRAQQAQPT